MADDHEWPKKKYANEQERKSHKPVLEKKRRQRINKSLEALKNLLLEAVKGEGAHHSKLEKADILEMTVKHLKETQQNQLNVAMHVDPLVLRRYQSGFNECTSEVRRYLSTVDGMNPELKARLVSHLSNCGNGINNMSTNVAMSNCGNSINNMSTNTNGGHMGVMNSQMTHVNNLQNIAMAPPQHILTAQNGTVSATPLYAGQVVEIAPMQISPTAILSNGMPVLQTQGPSPQVCINNTQVSQNQTFHVLQQQQNQVNQLQQNNFVQGNDLLLANNNQSAVSPIMFNVNRVVSPVHHQMSPQVRSHSVAKIPQEKISPSTSQISPSSPNFSPIMRPMSNQSTVGGNEFATPFSNYRESRSQSEVINSSTSFETTDSSNSTNETSALSSSSSIEMESKQNADDIKTSSRDVLNEVNNKKGYAGDNTSLGASQLINTPVILTKKIKSTRLFSHSTPKTRPLSADNHCASTHKATKCLSTSSQLQDMSVSDACVPDITNHQDKNIAQNNASSNNNSKNNQLYVDNADKENRPGGFLNPNVMKHDDMWRPW